MWASFSETVDNHGRAESLCNQGNNYAFFPGTFFWLGKTMNSVQFFYTTINFRSCTKMSISLLPAQVTGKEMRVS